MRTFFAGVDELLEAAAFRFLGGMIDVARESTKPTRQARSGRELQSREQIMIW